MAAEPVVDFLALQVVHWRWVIGGGWRVESAALFAVTYVPWYWLNMNDPKPSQLDKFKELARELEADEDEAHWDEKLGKLVKVKPKPEKPE